MLSQKALSVSVWEEVKNRVQIEEIIGEYVSLLPAGRNFKCLSPFRQEKTPSLIISPDKKIWHDFGSGDGGDVFEFVSRMENINRFEAMKKLAQKVGVKVEFNSQSIDQSIPSQGEKKSKTKFQKGLDLLEWSAKIYHRILLKVLQSRSNSITQYCLQRGLSQEIIETFHLGYAPKDNFLISLSRRYNLHKELLYEVGLLKQVENKNGQKEYRDKFSDRLMIPVKDLGGRVVGFTGRVLPNDALDRPKYLNSPQTEWFNKSKIWYGFDLNRKNFVHNRIALIVEGNMDVIAAYRNGLKFALASQGTSFTTEQLRILKSYVDTIWMAFDNDDAGQIAGRKLFLEATTLGFSAKKLIIPENYKDIDEYLDDLGKTVEQKNLQASLKVVNYIDWQIDQKATILSGDNLERQRMALTELTKLLNVVDRVSAEQYAGRLSKLTGVSRSTVLSLIKPNSLQTKPVLSSERETKENQDVRRYKEILVAWQKLAAYYLFFEGAKPTEQFVSNLFELLKTFFESLSEEGLLEEYLTKNRAMLELVWEEAKENASEEYLHRLKQMLLSFVDQRVDRFLLDPNKYQTYLELKKI